jgi:hypothetical protein
MTELESFLKRNGWFDEAKKDNTLKNKTILTFCLCFIGDLISSFDQYAMTHDWVITQFFTGLVAQGIWFMTGFFFFDAKSKKERVYIFIGTALGCGFGSTVMLVWLKPYFARSIFF